VVFEDRIAREVKSTRLWEAGNTGLQLATSSLEPLYLVRPYAGPSDVSWGLAANRTNDLPKVIWDPTPVNESFLTFDSGSQGPKCSQFDGLANQKPSSQKIDLSCSI
jgi:hypothetical protein